MIHIQASNTLAVSNSMPWMLPNTMKDGKNGAGSKLSSYDVINVSSDIPVSEEKMKTFPPIFGNKELQNTRKQVKKRLKYSDNSTPPTPCLDTVHNLSSNKKM